MCVIFSSYLRCSCRALSSKGSVVMLISVSMWHQWIHFPCPQTSSSPSLPMGRGVKVNYSPITLIKQTHLCPESWILKDLTDMNQAVMKSVHPSTVFEEGLRYDADTGVQQCSSPKTSDEPSLPNLNFPSIIVCLLPQWLLLTSELPSSDFIQGLLSHCLTSSLFLNSCGCFTWVWSQDHFLLSKWLWVKVSVTWTLNVMLLPNTKFSDKSSSCCPSFHRSGAVFTPVLGIKQSWASWDRTGKSPM